MLHYGADKLSVYDICLDLLRNRLLLILPFLAFRDRNVDSAGLSCDDLGVQRVFGKVNLTTICVINNNCGNLAQDLYGKSVRGRDGQRRYQRIQENGDFGA